MMKSSSSEDGSTAKRVKVLLADDHTMFREGLVGMLASSYGKRVEVVGKSKVGEEVVALAQEENPDVIIMQVDLTLKKAKETLRQPGGVQEFTALLHQLPSWC